MTVAGTATVPDLRPRLAGVAVTVAASAFLDILGSSQVVCYQTIADLYGLVQLSGEHKQLRHGVGNDVDKLINGRVGHGVPVPYVGGGLVIRCDHGSNYTHV